MPKSRLIDLQIRWLTFSLALLGCRGDRDSLPIVASAGKPPIEDPQPAAERCGELPRLEPGRLALIPESVVVFGHSSAPCDALSPGLLLENTGTQAMEVTQFSVAPLSFRIGAPVLPATVGPQETIRVELGYAPETFVDNTVEGSLLVMTSEGCAELAVQGLSAARGLITYSELAIDFGTLDSSEQSAPRSVTVLQQLSEDASQTEFSDFLAAPSGVFEIVRAPASRTRLASCESFSLEVRLIAPAESGPVEGGALLWLQHTATPEGIAEGTVYIPLLGRVDERPDPAPTKTSGRGARLQVELLPP